MGFVIHKYLSKSLTAPAPSSSSSVSSKSKKKKKTHKRSKTPPMERKPVPAPPSPDDMIDTPSRRLRNRRASLQHQGATRRSNSFRRASLQHESAYQKEEDDFYGDGSDHQRTLLGSPQQARKKNFSGSFGEQKLRQENKWLQVQLQHTEDKCNRMESKMFGTRDQLAYTNASWMDQLYSVRGHYEDQIFQQQRQAEAAENAVLEEELEEMRQLQHEVADTAKQSKLDNRRFHDEIASLQKQVQSWEKRYTRSEEEWKSLADNLKVRAKKKDTYLEESQRRVEWLEQELQAATKPKKSSRSLSAGYGLTGGVAETDANAEYDHAHLAILQSHRFQLEDRINELLQENEKLLAAQSQVEPLKVKVAQLEREYVQMQQEKTLDGSQQLRERVEWEEQKAILQGQLKALQDQVKEHGSKQSDIRREYTRRIEQLESEQQELRSEYEDKQKQWMSEQDAQEQTIQALRDEIETMMEERNSAPSPSHENMTWMERNGTVNDSIEEESAHETDEEAAPVSRPEDLEMIKQLELRLLHAHDKERDLQSQIGELSHAATSAQQQAQETEHRLDQLHTTMSERAQEAEQKMEQLQASLAEKAAASPVQQADPSPAPQTPDRPTSKATPSTSERLKERLRLERERIANRRSRLRSAASQSSPQRATPATS